MNRVTRSPSRPSLELVPLSAHSASQVRFGEATQLCKSIGVLGGHAEEATVTCRLPHVELCLNSGLAQCPVHANVVRKEPVACAAQKYDGGQPYQITEQR
jgi:hypothetical protein